ncbi:hypothetical protein DQ04_02951140 [Trypanosoma grayi]|uniref:hypothetical protein n=1 Tax=Trypanosoma grayi TaxID=71804 RepID=UPI0004F46DBB|nr:hypothetical protein DQ04_02951140 [Trypanosoma grayi]KEG11136.1 hypothetical protein DQ04_02951140 [Trypanosoma grayi]
MEPSSRNSHADDAAVGEGDAAACSIVAKQWDAVAVWSWNVQVETCAICKSAIADMCIECRGGGRHRNDSSSSSSNPNSSHARSNIATTTTSSNTNNSIDNNMRSDIRGGRAARPLSGQSQPASRITMVASTWDDDVTGECLIVWGVCNHVFHHHCISRWARQRSLCPICGREWEVVKTARNDS